ACEKALGLSPRRPLGRAPACNYRRLFAGRRRALRQAISWRAPLTWRRHVGAIDSRAANRADWAECASLPALPAGPEAAPAGQKALPESHVAPPARRRSRLQ